MSRKALDSDGAPLICAILQIQPNQPFVFEWPISGVVDPDRYRIDERGHIQREITPGAGNFRDAGTVELCYALNGEVKLRSSRSSNQGEEIHKEDSE